MQTARDRCRVGQASPSGGAKQPSWNRRCQAAGNCRCVATSVSGSGHRHHAQGDRSGAKDPVIFVDSNVPMYLVGAPRPNEDRCVAVLTQLAREGERFVIDAEVYQEILHRYTAIQRPDAIDAAFESLDAIVDDTFSFDMSGVRAARDLVVSLDGSLGAGRPARVRNTKGGDQSHLQLRSRLRRLPGHRSPGVTQPLLRHQTYSIPATASVARRGLAAPAIISVGLE